MKKFTYVTVKTGAELIAAERQRQIEQEGWTEEGDDKYENAELARAAACYAITAGLPDFVRNHHISENTVPPLWPWRAEWWKPGRDNHKISRIRELEKAGALIAAEIDRLLRQGETP